MKTWVGLSLAGIFVLAACAPRNGTPDELVLLDETVQLERRTTGDFATRDFTVDSDAFLVAIVEEKLTDVRVILAADGSEAGAPVEVENHLAGAGLEITTLAAPKSAHVTLELAGQADSTQPGRVHVRVLRVRKSTEQPALATRLAGYRAWTEGTRSGLRSAGFESIGAPALDRAIASFSAPGGDAALAAQAQLVKANGLRFFQLDFRASRAAAQAARQAFRSPATLDALGEARARYLEAAALVELSGQRATGNTSAEAAAGLAHELLSELAAAQSPLPPIERARAIAKLGGLEVAASNLDEGERHFAAAQSIYRAAGYLCGEREIRGDLALALLERGRFRDAAQAFEAMLPELERFREPDRRVVMYLGAARSQSFAGRTDRAMELLLAALEQARAYRLRVREAGALQGLGHAYQNRGDLLQARSFFFEALRIMREQNSSEEYVWALASTGVVAREDGDYAKAIEYHQEAVERATNPIAQVRTLRELGLDYYAAGDFRRAVAELRRSLAVPLQDPKHHAYSDVKRNLAQTLIEQANDTGRYPPAVLREASRLVDETLASSLEVGDKLGVIGAHRVRANLLAAEGRTQDALDEFEVTFALAKEYRDRSSSTEAKGATLTHEQYAPRGYLDVALRDVARRGARGPRPASPDEEDALYTVERARDTYYGPAHPRELDAATSARVDGLLKQMAERSVAIAGLLRTADTPARAAELTTLQASMSDLHAELDQVRTAAAARRVASADPADAPRLRELAPGTVQISYALGNLHAFVWARSAAGVRVATLAKSPRVLERELIALGALDRQAQPAAVEAALAAISADLLPRGLLPKSATALEIVSEGRIAAVPFAGLQAPDAPGRPLVESHVITMITSMYSADTPQPVTARRPFRLVALASGTSGLRSARVGNPVSRLQAAAREIRAVASLFTAIDPRANIRLMVAPQGSADELRRIWSSGADVVHFATHALADLRQPLASLLVMPATDANGAPTYLTAGQVEGWRGDAGLVFLSACDSAVGPPRYAGGMPGLQRAFLRAGADGVIATLWPIEDVLAQEFSADFYRRYTRGASAAQALGETQRQWLAPQPGVAAEERARRRLTALAHGFYRQ
jgi:tetratricopeptide (TPR) repeat protein